MTICSTWPGGSSSPTTAAGSRTSGRQKIDGFFVLRLGSPALGGRLVKSSARQCQVGEGRTGEAREASMYCAPSAGRLRSVALGLCLTLGFVLSACQGAPVPGGRPGAASEVKVGVLLPLSGQSATIGQQSRTGAEIAFEEINSAGGIKSMNGAKITPVWADSKSTPDGGVAEAERLALKENVSLIIGAYQSSVTFPASEVAERNKVPWLVQSSVKDEITTRGFKHVFRPNNMASYDAREVMESFKLFKEETGKGPKKMAVLYEATDWPQSTLAGFKKLAPEYGIELSIEEAYPPKQTDFTAQLLKIKQTNPDLLMVMMYTPEHIIFQKQFIQQKLELPYGLWTMGAGSEDPAFYKAVPQDSVENMFVQEDWDLYGLKKDWIKKVSDVFEQKLGYPLNAYGAQGYSNAYIVKEALEAAGSADRDKVREGFTKVDIKDGPATITGYQRIKFDETGQNTFAHGAVSQNQKGEHLPFWPKENRPKDAKLIWPLVSR